MFSENIVFLNGEFVDKNEAKISVFDRGFIFGDGVYEVVPIVNSKLVDKAAFWERFENSMKSIELKLPYTKDEFEDSVLKQLIEKNNIQEGGIYIQITRGVAQREFYFVKNLKPTVMAYIFKANVLENELTKTGIETISVPDIRWKKRNIKSISLLGQCIAKELAHKAGVYECFMTENGHVTECSSSSVFIIKNDTLITKALSNEILPGIRRAKIINIAKNIELSVEERNFTMQEVYEADEVFISAATIILLPVIKADDKLINDGKIGKYTIKLREIYAQALKEEAGVM